MSVMLSMLLAISMVTNARAHGMDKPGPHGGIIRMPGVFHTEVVPNKDGSLNVYLLDINFANPIVQNSSVALKIEQGKKENSFACQVVKNEAFVCRPQRKTSYSEGILHILAQRDVAKGETVYNLPFEKFDKIEEKKGEDQHASHH